ncbi:RNA polymerase sigma factor [Deinococcus misasensis]|uniref:RNA polymerase sigma factor n=1 Tax=Deinococcus misasensis TaxID=392413 RepID=UPI00054EC9CE|nr:sigma-70 family RNA polymerase sigma factor [Deinococcus misasensis]
MNDPTSTEHHTQLLIRIQRGDQDALRELFEDLGPTVKAVSFRMLGSIEDAEEVMQDAFVVLYNKASTYTPERASVKTYLCGIAHKMCLERLRSRSSRPQKVEEWDIHDPETETLSAEVQQQDDKIVVEKALSTLEPTEKKLLELAFYDGYSHSELVEHTGMALGTLKSKLRRALLKLKTTLEGL